MNNQLILGVLILAILSCDQKDNKKKRFIEISKTASYFDTTDTRNAKLRAMADSSENDKLFVNLHQYSIIDTINMQNIKPYKRLDYWAYRHSDGTSSNTIYKYGTFCGTNQSENLFYQNNKQLIPDHGFNTACLPDYCFDYIIASDKCRHKIYNTATEVTEFLGTVNNIDEALIITRANEYSWIPKQKNDGAFKVEQDGFYIVALKMVHDCAPIQVDRFLLFIDKVGNIKIIRHQKGYHIDKNSCI